MWRRVRISLLLLVLVVVAGTAVTDRLRTTGWTDTLWVGIFPANGDASAATGTYIDGLRREQFQDIESFFAEEAQAFGVALGQPVKLVLYPEVRELPPRLSPDANPLATAWWSLKMRYYTWRLAGETPADIRVFVLYHDPARTESVPHSLGLQKGLLGVVYAYADRRMTDTNNIVIAHEVLHTVGATDKYDLRTTLPLYPDGYADPDADPLYPQEFAEIMGARVPISEDEADIPTSLNQVVVGPATAREINWADPR